MTSNINLTISSDQAVSLDSSQLMSSFDWMNIAIAVFNAAGETIDINKKALELYGIIDKEKFLALKPRFFCCQGSKKSFNVDSDTSFREYFDYLSFSIEFSGLISKTGKAQHMLRIHPVYEKSEDKPKMFLVFITDLTSLKKQKKASLQLRDSLPFMMGPMGISTWTYDLASGLRIPDMGADLFPELLSMADFMSKLDLTSTHTLESIINMIVSKEKTEGNATLLIREKGRNRYLDVICRPQFEEGKVIGVFFLTKDVTLRKDAEQTVRVKESFLIDKDKSLKGTLRFLNSIVDKMPCLFFAKNVEKEFQYVMANTIFCELVGKDISQVLHFTDNEVFDGKFNQKFAESDIQAIDSGSVFTTEETYFNGKKRMWQTMKYYIEMNHLKLIVCMSLEVTDIYKAYDEVKQAKLLAEKSDKMKTTYLQNISHELITPLNAILGFSRFLLEPSSEEETIMYRKEIKDNTEILKEIMDEVVDLAKFESGILTSTTETFDLSCYYEGIRERYAPMVRDDVEFKLTLPCEKCVVSLDINHLNKIIHRAIMISIDNTYTGCITIGYKLVKGGVKFFIEDTGIGLSKEELESLIDKHENLNDFTSGMAFSYSLCNILSKIMGGTIEISSSKNEKTCVVLFLSTEVAVEPKD